MRAELEAHLEDKMADLVRIFPDLGRQEAERPAAPPPSAAYLEKL